jgi:predicted transcriptional regulator
VTIDSNIGNGAAVTISLVEEEPQPADSGAAADVVRSLNDKERLVLKQFAKADMLGVTDIGKLTGLGASSVSYQLKKLEAAGLLAANASKKRELTSSGKAALRYL